MPDLNIPIAFSAGVVSFFAPCVLPLLPAYVGYVTGVSAGQLKKDGVKRYWKKIIISNIFFTLGFSLVFMSLGAFAGAFGLALRRYNFLIRRIGGFVVLVFGLELAGVLRLPFLEKTKQFKLPKWAKGLNELRAFLIGVIFAAAWSPCIGVVLGSILTLAATSAMVGRGAMLLLVYSLGISIPFVVISFTLSSAPRYLKFISKRIGVISRISGILLALLGLLLLTDLYNDVSSFL
ncbi:sulfite exporter TauE/SafE family protein [Candidatus Woesebacteria bacterium]|nr:sulfite exporter TauE/SafE family protein [Candidatus Woesebacteria bacterium]